MISTISMILDGHVRGNKMIDMQMSNAKLNKRARRILMEELGVDENKADELILKHKFSEWVAEVSKNTPTPNQ